MKCENNCTIHSQSGIPVGSEAFQWSIRSSIPSSMIEREFVAGETRRRKGETLVRLPCAVGSRQRLPGVIQLLR